MPPGVHGVALSDAFSKLPVFHHHHGILIRKVIQIVMTRFEKCDLENPTLHGRGRHPGAQASARLDRGEEQTRFACLARHFAHHRVWRRFYPLRRVAARTDRDFFCRFVDYLRPRASNTTDPIAECRFDSEWKRTARPSEILNVSYPVGIED